MLKIELYVFWMKFNVSNGTVTHQANIVKHEHQIIDQENVPEVFLEWEWEQGNNPRV